MHLAEKILFMEEWAQRNQCFLQQKGEIGFGRPCVGIAYGQSYVDCDERNDSSPHGDLYEKVPNAYHKHDCLAVLVVWADSDAGADDDNASLPQSAYDRALGELYEWVTWLNANNWRVKVQPRQTYNKDGFGMQLELIMGGLSQPVLEKVS